MVELFLTVGVEEEEKKSKSERMVREEHQVSASLSEKEHWRAKYAAIRSVSVLSPLSLSSGGAEGMHH